MEHAALCARRPSAASVATEANDPHGGGLAAHAALSEADAREAVLGAEQDRAVLRRARAA